MQNFYVAVMAAFILCTCQATMQNWSHKVMLGVHLDVDCDDPRNLTEGALADSYKWILPNLTVVQNGWTDGNRRVEGTKGERMHIGEVKDSVHGIYHCVYEAIVNGTRRELVLKRGVNIYGPAYENWMVEYRMKLIIGGAAAGGLLGLISFVCLVYKCRWKDPNGGKDILVGEFNEGFVDNGVYENIPKKTDNEGEAKF